jgi:hypothetical protein
VQLPWPPCGDETEIGSFLSFLSPKVAKESTQAACHLALSLIFSPANFANVHDPKNIMLLL